MSKLSNKTKVRVRERAKGICEYCLSQVEYATNNFSIEHIIPKSAGGSDALENLALACQGCNNHKFTKTSFEDPLNLVTVELFHPRKQNWDDHFSWNKDCSKIIGITATGRATVDCLKLNRKGLVNLRKVLYAKGEHPPDLK